MVAALVDTYYYLLHLLQHYYQRWSPGDKARSQGHKRKCSPKKKGRASKKFYWRSPEKKLSQKVFQPFYMIQTIQNIVLSASRGQGNFQGL